MLLTAREKDLSGMCNNFQLFTQELALKTGSKVFI